MQIVISEEIIAKATEHAARTAVERALEGSELQRKIDEEVRNILIDTDLAKLIGQSVRAVVETQAQAIADQAARVVAPSIARVMQESMLDTTVKLLVSVKRGAEYWDEKRVKREYAEARQTLTPRREPGELDDSPAARYVNVDSPCDF